MIPSHHNHAGQMVWGDDECECKGCKQRWVFDKGWRAVPSTFVREVVFDNEPDPYKRFQRAKR